MASTSRSATWSGDSRFSLIMNVSENYVSDGSNNYSDIAWSLQLSSTSGYRTWTTYAENPLVAYVDGQLVCNQNITYDLQNNTITVASGLTRVNHDADGSKTMSFSASFTDVSNGKGSASLSGTLTLTRINRYAVTNSVVGSDIEGNFSVNYTKYINDYKYKLRVAIPNGITLENFDYSITDTTFTLSQEAIEELYTTYTNTNTFDLAFAVETWNNAGTTRLSAGNEKLVQCKITGATPIFDNFTFEDVNSTTALLCADPQSVILGYSNVKATISTQNKAVGQKGATIVKYRLVIGNQSTDITYSDNADVYGTINAVNSGTIQVYAIDSRGNSTLVTKLANHEVAYTPISIDIQNSNVERNDGQVGNGAVLTYSGAIWNDSFGSRRNEIRSASYQYKELGDPDWIDWQTSGITPTNITPNVISQEFMFGGMIRSAEAGYTFDVSKSYVFKITVSDYLSTSTFEYTMSSGIPNISLNENGVGIMCDYDETLGGDLQVGGQDLISIILSQASGILNFEKHNLTSTNVLSYNTSYYVEVGNLVIINFCDVLVSRSISGTTSLMTGAPAPASDVPFMAFSINNASARLHVGTDGNVKLWYSNMNLTSGEYWYGVIAYIKA